MQQEYSRSRFKKVPDDLTVEQGIKMLEQQPMVGASKPSAAARYASRSVVPRLASLFWPIPASPQSSVGCISHGDPPSEKIRLVGEAQIRLVWTFTACEYFSDLTLTPTTSDGSPSAPEHTSDDARASATDNAAGNNSGEYSNHEAAIETFPASQPADFNREIYYRNKLEFSLDGGWLPINVPFPLDIFVGDAYNTYPLKYTLVPIFASLRWQVNNVGMPWILRGNFDVQFTASITGVARGPESRYFAYLMGIRRNFVHRNWRTAPYFDVRLGVGNIDAKGPYGVKYAQGQDITFTVNMGSGVRYNFSPRFALSAGLNFMHISNLDLSESNGKPNWGVRNYGINVFGPMVGIDMQLGRHTRVIK